MRRAIHLRARGCAGNLVETFHDRPLRGTIATALFAIRNPELVDRLVFIAPIARREPMGTPLQRFAVAIIRGEWDGMCTDADAKWLFDALSGSVKRDEKISRAIALDAFGREPAPSVH